MLSELWGFYPRLQEKLICKDEKQAKQGGEKRVVVMLRCRFMVRNMQPPPPPSPHQGLCPYPRSCRLPSGPAQRIQKTHPLFILPKFSHVCPILRSFPLAGFRTLVLVPLRDPPSHISRKPSRRTCQAVLYDLPAIGCLAILLLAPVWSLRNPKLNYSGGTSSSCGLKSHKGLPHINFFPLIYFSRRCSS